MSTGTYKKYAAGQAEKDSERKVIEPLTKKERYNVKAAMVFKHHNVWEIVVNKTAAIKIASDGRKGCVDEQILVDLMEREKCVDYSVQLRWDDVNNRDCLTVIHGRRTANDKYRWLIKKWASLAEAHRDVETVDGHIVRLFCVAIMSRKKRLIKTNYAQQLLKIQSVTIEAVPSEGSRRTSTALSSASRTRRCHGTLTRCARGSSCSKTSLSGKTRS